MLRGCRRFDRVRSASGSARWGAPRVAALALALVAALGASLSEPWRGRSGPFVAELVLTGEASALQARWKKAPGDAAPPSLDRAAPGARAETLVFFAGCQPETDGRCKLWGQAGVTAPDGSVLAAGVEIPLSLEQPPPTPPALAVSEHGLGLRVPDAPGTYTFRMRVIDRVAGREVTLTRELQVAREP
jgi:hypothetical protein